MHIPEHLPEWVKAGAKFKLHGRLYHVHGVVAGVAVLKEWWRTKKRWNYTAEEAVHFWVAEEYITNIWRMRHERD
ncbi:hypothetical protein CPJ18_02720 [Agrobacterium rosae]|uniref:Uncharacterized protein n=1 Tax=Agrobacterium rosae TaxID=1972867 RepID=A0AAE5VRL3_9HYPH|nr:hypothetical protein CPJ18_02720 [Agrobacterium rosae]